MNSQTSAAERAKWFLGEAARRLNTVGPASVRDLSEILDSSLYLPLGDPAYRSGQPLLQPRFTETAADNLSFIMDTGGPGATPSDRVDSVTHGMSRLVGNNFGRNALQWFRKHSEPASESRALSARWGAWFGTGLDRHGLVEAQANYEWGPALMDSLPSGLYRLARIAVESLPGLRPAFSAIRCGRTGGSQQLTFEVDQALPLMSLEPLLKNLGLGHQHPSLMSATALILGARFTLPPNTATITLQPLKNGVEFRLDVILEALPDPPPQLHSLLRMQMAERPRSLRALDRWMTALTPDGYNSPGHPSILSVWIRPDLGARVALYLRPAALEGDPHSERRPIPEEEQHESVPAAAAGVDWSAWTPR